jgi:hypothetical protein
MSDNMLKIRDFVLVGDNGRELFLHPNYSNTKIACYTGMAAEDHEIPVTGKGGSNGKGTFRSFRDRRVQGTLRFKPTSGMPGSSTAVAAQDNDSAYSFQDSAAVRLHL